MRNIKEIEETKQTQKDQKNQKMKKTQKNQKVKKTQTSAKKNAHLEKIVVKNKLLLLCKWVNTRLNNAYLNSYVEPP